MRVSMPRTGLRRIALGIELATADRQGLVEAVWICAHRGSLGAGGRASVCHAAARRANHTRVGCAGRGRGPSRRSATLRAATMARGRFIALEGMDGSGTTSQARALGEALTARGHGVVITCEPSAGSIGTLIRDRLRTTAPPIAPEALALLFAADRLDHVRTEIEPALAEGKIVVCDRYVISSWVYQTLDCDAAWVRAINARAPWPDLTLVVQVPPSVALERRARRGAQAELFETERLQERVAAGYAAVVAEQHRAVEPVDGTPAPAAVTAALLERCVALGL